MGHCDSPLESRTRQKGSRHGQRGTVAPFTTTQIKRHPKQHRPGHNRQARLPISNNSPEWFATGSISARLYPVASLPGSINKTSSLNITASYRRTPPIFCICCSPAYPSAFLLDHGRHGEEAKCFDNRRLRYVIFRSSTIVLPSTTRQSEAQCPPVLFNLCFGGSASW